VEMTRCDEAPGSASCSPEKQRLLSFLLWAYGCFKKLHNDELAEKLLIFFVTSLDIFP
jgi:hypothetical protein